MEAYSLIWVYVPLSVIMSSWRIKSITSPLDLIQNKEREEPKKGVEHIFLIIEIVMEKSEDFPSCV